MDDPSTILDRHSRIMVWYLPHIFAPYWVVCAFVILVYAFSKLVSAAQINLNDGTKIIRPQLDAFMQSCNTDGGSSWHNSGFCPPPGGGEFGARVLNMSPGWFQQSHDVSCFVCL